MQSRAMQLHTYINLALSHPRHARNSTPRQQSAQPRNTQPTPFPPVHRLPKRTRTQNRCIPHQRYAMRSRDNVTLLHLPYPDNYTESGRSQSCLRSPAFVSSAPNRSAAEPFDPFITEAYLRVRSFSRAGRICAEGWPQG
jgi:hypothetical protein